MNTFVSDIDFSSSVFVCLPYPYNLTILFNFSIEIWKTDDFSAVFFDFF